MGLMDVAVKSSSIGRAHVEVDLSVGHELVVHASHDSDRYRLVHIMWRIPSGELVTLGHTRLDLREGTHEPGWQA